MYGEMYRKKKNRPQETLRHPLRQFQQTDKPSPAYLCFVPYTDTELSGPGDNMSDVIIFNQGGGVPQKSS